MITEPIEIQTFIERTVNLDKYEDDAQNTLSRWYYFNIYETEILMIQAIKTMLVGAKINIIPSVCAAAPPQPPERPNPMKYTELPLYKTPHYDYKDYVTNLHKCQRVKVKLLHEYLYPHVSCCRKEIQKTYLNTRCAIANTAKDICTTICENKREFKSKMRCPDNIVLRQAVVLAGGVVGYLIGGGRGIPRRLFFTSAGVLLAGALCFPSETDSAFRTMSYHTGKTIIKIFNSTCNKNFSLRERIPCYDDLPPPTKAETKNKCPKQ